MIDIWRKKFILSDSDRPAALEDIRPSDADYEALDPKTFDAIEAQALFHAIDRTQTEAGRLTLYRALARPVHDAAVLQQKQDALREIAENSALFDVLVRYVNKVAPLEKSLKYLLYGEFTGGLTTEEPASRSDKLEFGGYGYRQYQDGTQFAIELVEGAAQIRQP